MPTSNKIAYASAANFTITLASLATSATWVAGRQSTAVDNTSNLYLDYLVSGKITVGTTPTASTEIRVYAVSMLDDTTWPDTFGATDAAVTVTSNSSVAPGGYLRRLWTGWVDATTTGRAYFMPKCSVAQAFGGILPPKFALFVTHNTAVALNATAGNHQLTGVGVYSTNE